MESIWGLNKVMNMKMVCKVSKFYKNVLYYFIFCCFTLPKSCLWHCLCGKMPSRLLFWKTDYFSIAQWKWHCFRRLGVKTQMFLDSCITMIFSAENLLMHSPCSFVEDLLPAGCFISGAGKHALSFKYVRLCGPCVVSVASSPPSGF